VEVVNARFGFEIDLSSGRTKAMGEFGLEAIGDMNKILIETAQLQCEVSSDGEVAAHELCHPRRLYPGERREVVAREILIFLPWLNDSPGDKRP
jgi:hypothetical protein